ncbi:MAG: Bug family tripartite tricarboxylate transporter substrate binding protein [Hydrogenophaga sp.]|uniref:Bug family tripartite tricarboxylate transporter substrate binding protein n=1 Tax=Hydrogenophaga sp. TaxID=1904254 RepID=UPI003D0A827D
MRNIKLNFMPQIAGALACLLALFTIASPVKAQSWPSKPITIVVPYAPGGGTDITARLIGKRLSERLGQPVIVDNKPGANGMIGSAHVARGSAEGYTLLMGNPGPNAIGPILAPNAGYNPATDFQPVALLGTVPMLFCVNASSPIKTLQELITAGKSEHPSINFGSAGNGSPSHLAIATLNQEAGTKFVFVPYRGSAPVAVALLGNEIQAALLAGPDAISHLKAGKIRAIANMSIQRSPSFPDVPIPSEVGLAGMDVSIWYGILAPARTPKVIVERLHHEITAILEEPEIKARLQDLNITPVAASPSAFGAIIQGDVERYTKIIKAANIKLE